MTILTNIILHRFLIIRQCVSIFPVVFIFEVVFWLQGGLFQWNYRYLFFTRMHPQCHKTNRQKQNTLKFCFFEIIEAYFMDLHLLHTNKTTYWCHFSNHTKSAIQPIQEINQSSRVVLEQSNSLPNLSPPLSSVRSKWISLGTTLSPMAYQILWPSEVPLDIKDGVIFDPMLI